METTTKKVLMKGNEAIAEAAIRAGCQCYFGYPITPQNEIGAYMSRKLHESGGVFLQAESEVAAINMVYGCSATGKRCMTSSSSPGVSLKAEGVSYLAGADLPAVIISVQRGGPGLGTIQPSQGDYFQTTRALGHGDLCIPVLAPSSVQEMVDMTTKAFNLAEEYRTPVIILADGLLGQMMEPVSFPDESIDNNDNKADKSPLEWAAGGHDNKRDGNVITSLSLQPEDLEILINKRFKRLEKLKAENTLSDEINTADAELMVVAYGSAARVVQSAVNMAREKGLKVGAFRPITLNPFPEEALRNAAKNAKQVLVVEMSMGQMVSDVKAALEYSIPVKFYGRQGGFVPGPMEILEQIELVLKSENTKGGNENA